jgi:hypothetical protein
MKHESVFERHRGGFAGLLDDESRVRLNADLSAAQERWNAAVDAFGARYDAILEEMRKLATPSDNTSASPTPRGAGE